MKPTLLILAAGLGSRYGGLKQIDPVGPNGEIIIDYSIYDALSSGFGKIVFVIQHYFEEAFRKKIGSKFDNLIETAYAYQELDACLDEFKPPEAHNKPWGTGHAMLVARDVVHEPFAVINADDYYGPNSFKMIADFLAAKDLCPDDYAMVGWTLKDTLSEYGPVARGVCKCDEQMFLRKITECKKVHPVRDPALLKNIASNKTWQNQHQAYMPQDKKVSNGVEMTAGGVRYPDDNGMVRQAHHPEQSRGTEHPLTGNEIVSMNLWGFQPSIFQHLQSLFRRFLKEHGSEKDSELYIPAVIDELIEANKATVKVLLTNDMWFGVTYRRDRVIAARCIRELINQGLYPEKLWK